MVFGGVNGTEGEDLISNRVKCSSGHSKMNESEQIIKKKKAYEIFFKKMYI